MVYQVGCCLPASFAPLLLFGLPLRIAYCYSICHHFNIIIITSLPPSSCHHHGHHRHQHHHHHHASSSFVKMNTISNITCSPSLPMPTITNTKVTSRNAYAQEINHHQSGWCGRCGEKPEPLLSAAVVFQLWLCHWCHIVIAWRCGSAAIGHFMHNMAHLLLRHGETLSSSHSITITIASWRPWRHHALPLVRITFHHHHSPSLTGHHHHQYFSATFFHHHHV